MMRVERRMTTTMTMTMFLGAVVWVTDLWEGPGREDRAARAQTLQHDESCQLIAMVKTSGLGYTVRSGQSRKFLCATQLHNGKGFLVQQTGAYTKTGNMSLLDV